MESTARQTWEKNTSFAIVIVNYDKKLMNFSVRVQSNSTKENQHRKETFALFCLFCFLFE